MIGSLSCFGILNVLELVQAGGWLMIPIIACSIIALAITFERLWALRDSRVAPRGLVTHVWELYRSDGLDTDEIHKIRTGSPLGRVLATGLANRNQKRPVMKERVEETGRQVVHQLERYLNTLGTIASVTPLLGLLGTVIGMIKVFNAINVQGIGNAGVLAGGISEALITTAAGLLVAIPSLMFFRFFRGKVDQLVLRMEEEALKVIDVMHGDAGTHPVPDHR